MLFSHCGCPLQRGVTMPQLLSPSVGTTSTSNLVAGVPASSAAITSFGLLREWSTACRRPRTMRAALLVLLLIVADPSLLVASREINCNRGCPDNTEEACGEDGLTYQNSCLAICQGVQVVQQGRCGSAPRLAQATSTASFMEVKVDGGGSSSSSRSADVSSMATDQFITLQDMQMYSRQGYSLVGQGEVGVFEPQAPSVQQANRGNSRREAAAAAAQDTTDTGVNRAKLRQQRQAATAAVRHTSNGYTYQLRFTANSKGASADQASPQAAAALDPQLQPGGYISGFMPTVGQYGQPAFETSADTAATTRTGVSDAAAAAADTTGLGMSDADPASSAEDNPKYQSAETDLLVQYMQGGSGRKLLRTWQRAVSAVHAAWHTYTHHWHEHEPQHLQHLQQSQHGRQQQQQQQQEEVTATERSLKYIIGKDDRREVNGRANAWPFSTVGQFLYKKGSCTGVMIGPGAVLTAAHCVFSRERNMWQRDMVFVPHRHRQGNTLLEPYGRVAVDSVTTYSGWTNNPDAVDAIRYDLAVVRLADSTIGYKTGWLGLAWDKRPFKGKVFTTGYPGDKARGSMWLSTCNATDYGGSDTRFLTTCDSWNGQSGSPMWEKRGPDMFFLRAVLSYEACNCCTPDCRCCTDHTNGGCKITHMHYKNILKWRK